MTTQPKRIDAVTRQIATLTESGRQIRESGDIRAINHHKDAADSLRHVARKVGARKEEIAALWKEAGADRRAMGRMLREMAERGERKGDGRTRKKTVSMETVLEDPATLADLGITKIESFRSQMLSHIPDDAWADAIRRVEEGGGEFVTRDFLDIAASYKKLESLARGEGEVEEEEADEEEAEGEQEGGDDEDDQEDDGESTDDQEDEDEEEEADDTPSAAEVQRAFDTWNKSLTHYTLIVDSIRRMGGADVLANGWPADRVRDLADAFEHVIGRLSEIRVRLMEIADERS